MLKKSLIILIAILVKNLSYSQYPIIKKIGNDSLVLMTIKQGEDINKKFLQNRILVDSFKNVSYYNKNTIDSLKKIYDSLNNVYKPIEKYYNQLKVKYDERLNMPNKFYHDIDYLNFGINIILIGIILVQFQSLK